MGTAQNPPHIVIVIADDLGWGDVGFHGSEIATPVLDRLAGQGMELSRFYVSPICTPTRAALLTGRYPMRYGFQVGVLLPWAEYGLPLEERLLPEMLREAGYSTHLVGKWHVGQYRPEYLPTRRGFDHHYGHYLGTTDYFNHTRLGGLDWHRDEKPVREEGYTTELLANEAVRTIASHDGAKPLFLMVAFNAPHIPLQAPEDWLERYSEIEDKRLRTYRAMVSCMDHEIGRIVSALDEHGLWENTLFLFFSDNGGPKMPESSNLPLRGGKSTLYEGGVRVAALAYWRGRIEGGEPLEELVHVTDLLPTLSKICGGNLKGHQPLDGLDVSEALLKKGPSPRREILHNINHEAGALQRDGWKLVVRFGADGAPVETELFDLLSDPGETLNLSGKNPEKAGELLEVLEGYRKIAAPAKISIKPMPENFVAPEVWGEVNES